MTIAQPSATCPNIRAQLLGLLQPLPCVAKGAQACASVGRCVCVYASVWEWVGVWPACSSAYLHDAGEDSLVLWCQAWEAWHVLWPAQ